MLKGVGGELLSVAISADGSVVATGYKNGYLIVWELKYV